MEVEVFSSPRVLALVGMSSSWSETSETYFVLTSLNCDFSVPDMTAPSSVPPSVVTDKEQEFWGKYLKRKHAFTSILPDLA